ncbi:MAG: biotin/lipoyl-containing protein [Thermoanaerobaculia bacterium]
MKFIARRDGNDIPVTVERHGGGYLVKLGEREMVVDLVRAGSVHSLRLEDGTQFALVHHRSGSDHEMSILGRSVHVEIIDPLSLKRGRSEDGLATSGMVRALMPGRVVRVLVAKGDPVQRGAGLVVFEAMKMENEILSPIDGVVEEVFVEAGQTVDSGAELVRVSE